MQLHSMMCRVGEQARTAMHQMAQMSAKAKVSMLEAMARSLDERREEIKAANARDLEAGRDSCLSAAMLDRLALDDARIDAMIKGVLEVAALPEVVGRRIWRRRRANGLVIEKRRVPLGVVAIIYESRPNVTADAAVLCLKTSNAVILRGGKEAFHSNQAIARALVAGGVSAGMPPAALQLIETTDREAVRELVRLEGYVDVVIPRGGESLIRAVVEHARVPVLKHYKGVCHIFVDAGADQERALAIVENAKCQRPGVCNALETLLVHRKLADEFLPRLAVLAQQRGIELRCCAESRAVLPACHAADDSDWEAEYLDLILAVKVVGSCTEAIEHINRYGSHHSDAILTQNDRNGRQFLKLVDSAAVYLNASTRFTDGGEFGMGAEMGISTDKLHARGPMGIEELTTYKFVVSGSGQIR